MRLWRLSSFPSAGRTFDGEGARLYPGRWNDEGVPVVYTSEHLSLAVVELFVHLEPRHLKRPHYAFSVQIDDGLLEVLPASRLPPDWKAKETPASTRALGSAWARACRTLGLVVPSVVVPSERNVILNPRHPAFAALAIDGPSRFEFDPRMSKGPRPT
jgi:RES domain-containing protein